MREKSLSKVHLENISGKIDWERRTRTSSMTELLYLALARRSNELYLQKIRAKFEDSNPKRHLSSLPFIALNLDNSSPLSREVCYSVRSFSCTSSTLHLAQSRLKPPTSGTRNGFSPQPRGAL